MESKLPLGGGLVYGARGREEELKDGTGFERVGCTDEMEKERKREKVSGEAKSLLTGSRLAKLHR